MQIKITLSARNPKPLIPINYSYPLSAAIYRIISKGNAEYAAFLHEEGYGKGFKFFSFSQLQCNFKIAGDRFLLLQNEAVFKISFHLPKAMENFIKGLFQSEQIDIADKKSRAVFQVASVESLPDPLQQYQEAALAELQLKPLSPLVAGLRTEDGKYQFLSPDQPEFLESLIFNWRSKIATCFDDSVAASAMLIAEIIPMKMPFKSRLITIKADTAEETKIRGWMNFGLKVIAEKRFAALLLNAGVGVYNAQGMGYMEVIR